jgi:hypothetical protein
MHKFCSALGAALLTCLVGCSAVPSTKPLEGVAVSKVIDQIKQDLANSSVANLRVGDGSLHACGEDTGKPLVLMRAADPPTVTLKLSTARAIDITGDAGVTKEGDPLIVAVPEINYSQLGKQINEAELGILGANHELRPCLQPTKLSVNVLVDVTRTVAANGTVGFALLYSVTAKTSRSNEIKNQIQVDLAYDKNTPAAFTDQ